MTSDDTTSNPLKDKPGETPEQARQRAQETIERAAARGNRLAQQMNKKNKGNK